MNNSESFEHNKASRDNFRNIQDFSAAHFPSEETQRERKRQQDIQNREDRDNFKNIANFTDTFLDSAKRS